MAGWGIEDMGVNSQPELRSRIQGKRSARSSPRPAMISTTIMPAPRPWIFCAGWTKRAGPAVKTTAVLCETKVACPASRPRISAAPQRPPPHALLVKENRVLLADAAPGMPRPGRGRVDPHPAWAKGPARPQVSRGGGAGPAPLWEHNRQHVAGAPVGGPLSGDPRDALRGARPAGTGVLPVCRGPRRRPRVHSRPFGDQQAFAIGPRAVGRGRAYPADSPGSPFDRERPVGRGAPEPRLRACPGR